MSNKNKIVVIGITGALMVGAAIYLTSKHKRRRIAIQRQEIADEGYETAFDILYPLKSKQLRRYKSS